MTNNELERKPADITNRCLRMLDEAIKYYKEKAPAQAEILRQHFFKEVLGIWHASRGTDFEEP
jgi:hypothetical protein